MDETLMAAILGWLVAGIAVIYAWRKGNAADVGKLLNVVFENAQVLALAADQMAAIGKIEKEKRFAYVLSMLIDLYPKLPTDKIEAAIEAAVGGLKHEDKPVALILPARPGEDA